jgi:hypothetical protein
LLAKTLKGHSPSELPTIQRLLTISRGVDDGTFKKNIDPVQMAIILWSNATVIMKLKDRNDYFWLSSMNVNY